MNEQFKRKALFLTLLAIQTFIIYPLLPVAILLAADKKETNSNFVDINAPRVIHKVPVGGLIGKPVEINAIVTDDFQVEKVILNYRAKGDKEYIQKEMQKSQGDNYAGLISFEDKSVSCIDYWIEAVDLSSNTLLVGYTIMPKTICLVDPIPTVDHTPKTGSTYQGDPLPISANVKDNLEVNEVTLFYRSEGESVFKSTLMKHQQGDTYLGIIPQSSTNANSVEYYLKATDNAGGEAPSGSPETPYAALLSEQNSFSVNAVQGEPMLIFDDQQREEEVIIKIKPWYKKWWVWTLAGGVLIAASSGSSSSGAGNPEEPVSLSITSATP